VRVVWAKALLLLLSLGVSLLFAELTIRLVMPQNLSIWSSTRGGIVIHRANVRGYVTQQGKRFDTNSVGMRDGEHPRFKAPGTYRILLMGDSFMEATQVEWADSLAARLEQELEMRLDERSAPDIEIINASVSGWGTDDQRTYYLRYARAWKPDLVLLAMTLHNDLFDNLAMEFSVLDGGRVVDRPAEELPWTRYLRIKVQEWLAGHSHLYRLATGTLRADAIQAAGRQLQRDLSELVRRTPSPKVERGWAMTHLLLDRFAAEVRADGAELAIFMVPLRIQVEPDHRTGFLEELALDESSIDLVAPQRRMADWGDRRDVLVIDLLPGFLGPASNGGEPYYLELDGHWNEAGHALGAEIVARALARSALIPSGTPIAHGSGR